MLDPRTSGPLPPGTLLVGTLAALWQAMHEKDDPTVPCLRFNIFGGLVAASELAGAAVSSDRIKIKSKVLYGVTLYPFAPGQEARAEGMPGDARQELKKARDSIAQLNQETKQIWLVVGGLSIGSGSAEGGQPIRLHGLQLGTREGALQGIASAMGGPDRIASAVAKSAPPALPAVKPVVHHPQVTATGILAVPKAAKVLRPITALTFRSSSATRATLPTPTDTSVRFASVPTVLDPPVAPVAPGGRRNGTETKRPRASSPVSGDQPPAKRRHSGAGYSNIAAAAGNATGTRTAGFEGVTDPAQQRAAVGAQVDSVQVSPSGPPAAAERSAAGNAAERIKAATIDPVLTRIPEQGAMSLRDSGIDNNGWSSSGQTSGPRLPFQDSGQASRALAPRSTDRAVSIDMDMDANQEPPPVSPVPPTAPAPPGTYSQGDDGFLDDPELLQMIRQAEEEGSRKGHSSPHSTRGGGDVQPPLDRANKMVSPDARGSAGVNSSPEMHIQPPRARVSSSSSTATRDRQAAPSARSKRTGVGPSLPRSSSTKVDVFSPNIAAGTSKIVESEGAGPLRARQEPPGRVVQLTAGAAAGPSRPSPASMSGPVQTNSSAPDLRRHREAQVLQERRDAQAAQASRLAQAAVSVEQLKEQFTVANYANPTKVPITYVPLRSVRPNQGAHVIGVVVRMNENSKKGDWLSNVVVTDPSLFDARDFSRQDALAAFTSADDDVPLTIFRREQVQLPPQLPMGAVFLIQDLFMVNWQGKTKGQSRSKAHMGMCWLIGSTGGIMYPLEGQGHLGPGFRASREEEARMRALARWYEQLGLPTVAAQVEAAGGVTSAKGSKTMSLCDLRHEVFADIICKVLSVESSNTGFAQLYVTDGTRSTAPHPWRNWHGIDRQANAPGDGSGRPLPKDAIYCLTIMSAPPRDEQELLQPGNVLSVRNVRGDAWGGELEMVWSEMMTEEQAVMGWKRRQLRVLSKEDERVKAIERRIRTLQADHSVDTNPNARQARPPQPEGNRSASRCPDKTGQYTDAAAGPSHRAATSMPRAAAAIASVKPDVPLSDRIMSTYQDELAHPYSTLTEIAQNTTVPNRYNVKARVRSLHPIGVTGKKTPEGGNAEVEGGLVVKVCRPCARTSCNDTGLSRASYAYRFIALLESPQSSALIDAPAKHESPSASAFAVLIADEEATAFLPALPPLTALTNPNEVRTIERQIAGCIKETYSILMGSKMDGHRVRPVIRWSVESYTAQPRSRSFGKKGKCRQNGGGRDPAIEVGGEGNGGGRAGVEGDKGSQEKGVIAYRVFGMERKR